MQQRNLIHLLFGCTLRICFFNLLNVCTYHSEFITAPLSRNSSNCPTRHWPWLYPQKTAPRIFSHVVTTDATPLSFCPWVIMMNSWFIICNYSWQKCISFSLCCRCSAQMFFWGGSCVLHGQHVLHPLCANFSAAKFSDEGHNCQLPIPIVAQFTWCDVIVIPNQHINFVLCLCCHYHGWSATAGTITNVLPFNHS